MCTLRTLPVTVAILSALIPHECTSTSIQGIESVKSIYLDGQRDSDPEFGGSLAVLHDMDNDGVIDAAIGAPMYLRVEGSQYKVGKLWMLHFKTTGSFKDEFNALDGREVGLSRRGKLARSIASINDIDGNGHYDMIAGTSSGFVVVYLDGIDEVQFAHISPADLGAVGNDHDFGASVCGTTLLNDTATPPFDFVAGNPHGDGEVVFVDLDATGAVNETWRVDAGDVGLGGLGAAFGSAVALLPDLDGNGARDLLVGAPEFSGGDGLALVVMMAPDYRTVESSFYVERADIGNEVTQRSRFGASVAFVSYVNDTLFNIAVGAPDDSTVLQRSGAVVMVSLSEAGEVFNYEAINNLQRFSFPPKKNAQFGTSVAGVSDLNRNGHEDLFVGVPGYGCCGYVLEIFFGPEFVQWDDALVPTPPPTEQPSLSSSIFSFISYTFTIAMICSCGYFMLWRCRESLFGHHNEAPPPAVAPQRQGVERSVLDSIPVFKYESLVQSLTQTGEKRGAGLDAEGGDAGGISKGDVETCCICLCDYERHDLVRQLPCSHFFHCSCIEPYLENASTCPLCRRDVAAGSEPRTDPTHSSSRTPTIAGRLRTHPTLLAGFLPSRVGNDYRRTAPDVPQGLPGTGRPGNRFRASPPAASGAFLPATVELVDAQEWRQSQSSTGTAATPTAQAAAPPPARGATSSDFLC